MEIRYSELRLITGKLIDLGQIQALAESFPNGLGRKTVHELFPLSEMFEFEALGTLEARVGCVNLSLIWRTAKNLSTGIIVRELRTAH